MSPFNQLLWSFCFHLRQHLLQADNSLGTFLFGGEVRKLSQVKVIYVRRYTAMRTARPARVPARSGISLCVVSRTLPMLLGSKVAVSCFGHESTSALAGKAFPLFLGGKTCHAQAFGHLSQCGADGTFMCQATHRDE